MVPTRLLVLLAILALEVGCATPHRFVEVTPDHRGFQFTASHQRFVPWGFNYDRDHQSRLLEDYWIADWANVVRDFRAMKALGATTVRIHLQFGRFMRSSTEADPVNLQQLSRLVSLAEKTGLYLDLTGLGCYHKADVPAWYDQLDEPGRWQAQARFWEIIAQTCAQSPAIFCYDLMNEPVVPGGRRAPGDWLGPPFGGSCFVQCISLDQAGRDRAEIGRRWVDTLTTAIRRYDRRHLITVGLVDWSLDRPGMQSGMVPSKIGANLDFISVHLYPKDRQLPLAMETLAGFAAAGKPVVIEETFLLDCSANTLSRFLIDSRQYAAGWIGFYWGPVTAPKPSFAEALMLRWLELFQAQTKPMLAPVK